MTSSPLAGTELPDQFAPVFQAVELEPFQVFVAANKLDVEMMAITIKIEILIEFFIVLCIYV